MSYEKQIKKVAKSISKTPLSITEYVCLLEKSLDKACEILEDLSRFTEHGTILRNKEEWKEWLMYEN